MASLYVPVTFDSGEFDRILSEASNALNIASYMEAIEDDSGWAGAREMLKALGKLNYSWAKELADELSDAVRLEDSEWAEDLLERMAEELWIDNPVLAATAKAAGEQLAGDRVGLNYELYK